MSNFYTDVLRKDARFASTEAIKDMGLLEPGFRAKVDAFVAEAKAAGHQLFVAETYRSQARQHALYLKRLTQLSKVGVHGYGLAVDLGLMHDGKYDPNGVDYRFFVTLAAKHKMISGIDWGSPHAPHSFRDWDHLQGVPVFRQTALFAGTWYPEAGYDPYADMAAHHVTGC